MCFRECRRRMGGGMTRSDAGEGGMILHTADGGQHWDVQVGDPHSGTRAFEQLYFLDATHGWATEDGDGGLLRNYRWADLGKRLRLFGGKAFVFSTPDVGVYLDGTRFFAARMADAPGRRFTLAAPESRWTGWRAKCSAISKASISRRRKSATPRLSNLPDKSSGIAKTEDGGLTGMSPAFCRMLPLGIGTAFSSQTPILALYGLTTISSRPPMARRRGTARPR